VYTDPDVAQFITGNFIAARAHVKEQPEALERFGAQWTPTILILDPNEKEQHRIEGFLPADDFLAQLRIGLAHAARTRGDFADAERRYRELSSGEGDVAAESLYWAGVSRYKHSNDATALGETAKAFQSRFKDSAWAKKASVWD
jgi:Thioredoxin-like domain